MATGLDGAVDALMAARRAFPMPMAPEVAMTAMVVGMAALMGMLYFNAAGVVVTRRRVVLSACAIAAAIAVLALGNSSIRNREAAMAMARIGMDGECRAVRTAATAEPDHRLAPDVVRSVLDACGPAALQTMAAGRPTAPPAGAAGAPE